MSGSRRDDDSLPSRSARSVRRILDAASRMFGRDGYQGASMGDVARAAGVSKGLLHYHFHSKEHLLIEAVRAAFRQIFRRFDERYHRGERGIDAAMDSLDSLWAVLVDMRDFTPFMVETVSLGLQEQAVRRDLDAFYTEAMQLLEKGIVQLLDDDRERLTVPPERLAPVIRTAMHGLIIDLAYANTSEELARVEQTFRDMRLFFRRAAVRDVALSAENAPER